VAFYNLPQGVPVEAHHLPLAALKPAFHLFVQHLYSLLALPTLPNSFDADRPFAALSPFQLDTLMRIRATENVEEAQKTLAGIVRLVDKIEEMKVGQGVRGKVLEAVEHLETVRLKVCRG
jgi:phosphatidylinositol glycan class S